MPKDPPKPRGLNPWKIQGYKPGQNVICKIMKSEPGGYAVIIPKDNLPGYLPTDVRHNVGEEVLVTYVCVDKNRMLLAERYGKTTPTKGQVHQQIDWTKHLAELDEFADSTQPAADGGGYQQPYQQQYDSGQQPSPFAPPPSQSFDDPYAYQGQGDSQSQYMTGPLPQQGNQYMTGPLPSQGQYNQYATGPLPPVPPHMQPQPGQQYNTQPIYQQAQQPFQAPPNQQIYQQQQQQQQPYQQPFQAPPGPPPYAPPPNMQQPYQESLYQSASQPYQESLFQGTPQPHQPVQEQQYMTGAQPAQRYAEGVPTTRFRLQRAIDLIMPPVDQETLKALRIGDYDVEWLITDLEGGMRTGCVKAACESRLSRAAMLLYKGRAVGCIYGCKADPTTKPTEESLQLMLADLESPDTMVTLYDLPEEITLAMSSLFLGYPVERGDDYNARDYLDYICNWLGEKSGTATLAISLSQNRGTCLGYIYKGAFAGAFYVEDQVYRPEKQFVDELLANDPQAGLEVSILPPEMHTSAVRFGFSLSMARTRKME